MTAQPEVVWMWQWGESLYDATAPGDEIKSATFCGPYVPQASLTAALAERDKARRDEREAIQHVSEVETDRNEAEAERDKLAKELGEAVKLLADSCGYIGGDWRDRRDAFLTAQAAQGEKG